MCFSLRWTKPSTFTCYNPSLLASTPHSVVSTVNIFSFRFLMHPTYCTLPGRRKNGRPCPRRSAAECSWTRCLRAAQLSGEVEDVHCTRAGKPRGGWRALQRCGHQRPKVRWSVQDGGRIIVEAEQCPFLDVLCFRAFNEACNACCKRNLNGPQKARCM